jgi:hypothetical protein
MKRRQFVMLSGWALGAGMSNASVSKISSLADARIWLNQLAQAPGAKSTGKWPLSSVLEHLAQSIEMSMEGFPEPKSALFQSTVGAAAFAVFQWRGKMSHGLDEPIPGAPVLTNQTDWKPAANRLRAAITKFEAHNATLKPHFAYGSLTKTEFAQAHVFHIANHQDEIVAG